MKIIKTKSILKKFVKDKPIGLIPTMGALHKGHLSLIRKSLLQNPYTLVSIFVNPKQFRPDEDYATYPRNLKEDLRLLSELKVDAVFCPDAKEMYGSEITREDFHTYLGYQELEKLYCGQYRPGFFNGVMLVVLKLFNLVKPVRAYFGKKDYQQFFLIKKMVEDLDLDIQVIGLPTVRNKGGLALSSRNQYLSQDQRIAVESIYQKLQLAKKWVALKKMKSPDILKKKMIEEFSKENVFRIQYLEVVDRDSLLPTRTISPAVILLAGFIAQVRLIDNIEI